MWKLMIQLWLLLQWWRWWLWIHNIQWRNSICSAAGVPLCDVVLDSTSFCPCLKHSRLTWRYLMLSGARSASNWDHSCGVVTGLCCGSPISGCILHFESGPLVIIKNYRRAFIDGIKSWGQTGEGEFVLLTWELAPLNQGKWRKWWLDTVCLNGRLLGLIPRCGCS